jgi:DegV family protein with EDD domain
MADLCVVTDSCHYIPQALLDEQGIEQVPLHVLLPDGEDRLENSYGGDYSPFYEVMGRSAELPKTSQPSTGEFLEVFTPLLDQGKEIIGIFISGGVSGTFAGAQTARETLGERGSKITLVDSNSCAGGEALTVLAAAAAARSGMSAEAAANHTREAREHAKLWFAVDTLEYFHKGGRIGSAQAWIGAALKIKPILGFSAGEIEPVERVRTSKRVLERMTEYLHQLKEDNQDAWVVQHSADPSRAAELAARGEEIMGCPPLLVSEIGPVLGTYAGPGMLGVAGVPSRYVNL